MCFQCCQLHMNLHENWCAVPCISCKTTFNSDQFMEGLRIPSTQLPCHLYTQGLSVQLLLISCPRFTNNDKLEDSGSRFTCYLLAALDSQITTNWKKGRPKNSETVRWGKLLHYFSFITIYFHKKKGCCLRLPYLFVPRHIKLDMSFMGPQTTSPAKLLFSKRNCAPASLLAF